MTDRQARHLEMVELALRAADGELDAEGYARLESLLASDAKAREDYAELVLVLSALDWDAGSETHVALAADHAMRYVILSDVVDDALAERRKHEVEADAQSQLLADLEAQERERDLDRRRAALRRKEGDRQTKVDCYPEGRGGAGRCGGDRVAGGGGCLAVARQARAGAHAGSGAADTPVPSAAGVGCEC